MRQVLMINGHPDKQSFNHALAKSYAEGANQAGVRIAELNIGDLKFDPNLAFGYRQRMPLEPDLLDAIEKIRHAEHIVWVFPMWWYGVPALMKGFIDRTFLPGIAFQMEEGKAFPTRLFKGKTGRIIVTSDTPRWYDYLWMGSPALNQFKKGTLEFCGISPVKTTYIAPIKGSTPAFRQKWLDKAFKLGRNLG